jgi:hypothetical protein
MEDADVTERDYELLSAYLDDMLDAGERSALEQRLRQDPALQQELDALQDTIALIKQLPTLKAPRNFTLTADMVAIQDPAPRKITRFPVLSALSTAAAFILIALGLVLLADGNNDAVSPSAVAVQSIQVNETANAQDFRTEEVQTLEQQNAPVGGVPPQAPANTGGAAGQSPDASVPASPTAAFTDEVMMDDADDFAEGDFAEAEEEADMAMEAFSAPTAQPTQPITNAGDAVQPTATQGTTAAQARDSVAAAEEPAADPAAQTEVMEEDETRDMEAPSDDDAIAPVEDGIAQVDDDDTLPLVLIGLGTALLIITVGLWWRGRA